MVSAVTVPSSVILMRLTRCSAWRSFWSQWFLSAAPRASVDLWDAVKAGDHARAHDLHLKLLALWNALMPHDNLPASTKSAQSLQGCPAGVARQPMAMPDAAHQARIKTALDALGTLAAAAE